MSIQRKALQAPIGLTTIIGVDLMQQAIEASRSSPRKRVILPLHKTPDAPLQRMLNAIQPDSYIQPHRHLYPPKQESIIVLQGSLLYLVFGAHGDVQEILTLAAGTPEFGFDSEAGIYHTFLALRADTVVFEVKPGPYEPTTDKDFASWAPGEDSAEVQNYLASLYRLTTMPKNQPRQETFGRTDG